MTTDKTDQVLVITGGTRGIGLATCQRFLEQGYRIINLSRSDSPLPEVTQLRVDLSSLDWVDAAAEPLSRAVGRPDRLVVIHNAATLYSDSVQDLDAAQLAQVMQTNVIAPLQLNQCLLPVMGEGSSILYVGSTLSEKAVAGSCSYVTSKHALAGLMRSTCQDLAGTGIHTACVCPGFTNTEMLCAHVGGEAEILAAIAEGVTFKRLVEPEEIARLLSFCADNPAINGAVLHANLGQIEH